MTELGKAITEMLKAGLPRRAIISNLGCSSSTVDIWASKIRANNHKLEEPKGIAGAIIKLRKQGKSYKKIQKELGCSRSLVSKYCALVPNNDKIKAQNIVEEAQRRSQNAQERIGGLISEKRTAELIRNYANKPKNGSSNRNRSLRLARKMFILKPANYSCQICKYDKYWGNLALHHRDPREKDINISDAKSIKLEILIKETKKCVVLCHNCHGEVHMGMQDIDNIPKLSYEKIPVSPKKWLDRQIENGKLPIHMEKLISKMAQKGDKSG